jgi:putative ABC transport system permease protein
MRLSSLSSSVLLAISRRKIRAALMMLGVILGVVALTVLASIGESTRQVTMSRFKNMLGTFDTLVIRPGGGKSRGMVSVVDTPATLTFADADAISAEVPAVRSVVQVENVLSADVGYRDRHETPGVFGVSANWAEVRGDQLEEGDFIDAADVASQARVVVLGAALKARLFPDEDPLGKTIRIGQAPFTVKGVLEPRGVAPTGASLDNLLFTPVSTAAKRLFNRDYLTMIVAQLRDERQSDAALVQVRSLLRARHRLALGALDDFTVTSPKAVMGQISAFGSELERLLRIAALLAMLLGGVVITVVMLISVSARRREIGLRRAVGATRRAILLQFLGEALVVSALGGAAGAAIGIGGVELVCSLEKLPVVLDPGSIGLALAVSVGLGLVFGAAPAVRAARVDPIAALRA